jgi:hypothetical protein
MGVQITINRRSIKGVMYVQHGLIERRQRLGEEEKGSA